MRFKLNRDKTEYMKRLAALMVAVVFVLGTALIPSDIYAVEGDDQDAAAAEAAEPEAAGEDVAEDAEAAEPEADVQEEGTAEVSDGDLTDLLVVSDEDGNRINLEDLDEDQYDGFIYKMKEDTTNAEINEMEEAIDDLDKGREAEVIVENELYAADSIETIGEIAEPEQIEYIEPNYYLKLLGAPSDPYYTENGWYLEMIEAPYVWEKGMFGDGATVAVLDTGVKMGHEDFENTKFTKPYNPIDGSEDVTDNVGHGTAVAGIISASYDNGKGITGIMPDTTIMPVKVMESDGAGGGTGTPADIEKGIDYAVESGADVINMSLGSKRSVKSLREACESAADKGVIIVAPAGNEAQGDNEGAINPIEYPASYDCVVSVGSIESDGDNHSNFSNYNPYVAVAAPGRGIFMPWAAGKLYVWQFGTSFSTPQVAAMAAMVKSMRKSIDYDEFMDIIAATAIDKGDKGRDYYFGFGLMSLKNAYIYVKRDVSLYEASLSGTSYVYDGKSKTPSVTVRRPGGTLSADNYSVSYSSGRTAVGTYQVAITGKGDHTGKKTLSFTIAPPLVKAIKAPQRYKKKLTVRWYSMTKAQKKKYSSAITGYQVRVSTNAKFTDARYARVKGIAKTKTTVKNLKRKTTYYVQYRSYKNVGGTIYYSKWSGTKKVRTK